MVAVPLLTDADAQACGPRRPDTLGALPRDRGRRRARAALMRDPSASVRKKAAWALGAAGAPVSVAGPALQEAAAQRSRPVRALVSRRRHRQPDAAEARLKHGLVQACGDDDPVALIAGAELTNRPRALSVL